MIKFKTNIMMNNLPFVDTLTRSVKYSHLTGTPCQECLTEPDSWQHLWTCPVWSTRLHSIISIAQNRIKTHLTRLSKAKQHRIDLTYDKVSCSTIFDFPSSSNTLNFDFSLLLMEFVPKELADNCEAVIPRKSVTKLINELIYTIHTEFRSQIWKPRCIKLDTINSSNNVFLSTQNPTTQRTTTSCTKRVYSHFNIDSRTDRPNNWVSWISEKVSQNKLWSNFSRYVNSLRIF